MDDVVIARALHVLGVVHWIGGVAFITLVVLPLAAHSGPDQALKLFEAVERRFSAQVRFSIPLVGATGLWMSYRMELWSRFADPHFWWMGAMLGVWLIFALIVFVLEPLLHARFKDKARRDSVSALRAMSFMHLVLLALAAMTAFGAVVWLDVFLTGAFRIFDLSANEALEIAQEIIEDLRQGEHFVPP